MSKTSHLLLKQNSQQPKQFRGGEKKVMKKSLSLLVAIAMVFSMFATVVSAADKTAGEKLKELGVITGTSEGLQEDAEWRRADVAILVSRLYGKEAAAKATTPNHGFTDLTDKNYGAYVTWAKEEGLFLGKTETTFGPLDNITNGQFSTVVLRALKQDQKDEAKNLEKAIELGLLAEGTVQTDAAKRGTTYSALVAALDVKVDGKKLGTILDLPGYQIVDLAIESASAVVAKTIVVDFNAELAAIAVTDVKVTDSNDANVLVESVSVEGTKATIKLNGSLSAGKEYTVSIAKATAKEATALTAGKTTVTYTKGIPASVSLNATSVGTGKTLGYTVKDANGNDITADFGLDQFKVESSTSAITVVSGKLTAANTPGYSVVSLELNDNADVKTGLVTVNVFANLSLKVDTFKAVITGGGDVSNNTIYRGETSATGDFNLIVKNEENVNVVSTKTTPVNNASSVVYTSSNPAVLYVDQTTGQYNAISAGSASVTVTVKSAEGHTVNASYAFTVKDERKPTSFELQTNSVTVNNTTGSLIGREVTVLVKDQYGNEYTGSTAAVVNAAVANTALAQVDGGNTSTASTTTDSGKVKFLVTGEATKTGNTTLDITVNDINNVTRKASISVVNAAAASGYAVEPGDTTLDSNKKAGVTTATTTTVKVYVKDINGVYIAQLTGVASATPAAGEFGLVKKDATADKVVIAGAGVVTPAADKTGTEVVNVVVGTSVIHAINFNVVASDTDHASSFKQLKSSITVANDISAADLLAQVIGSGKALVAINPDGKEVAIDSTVNYSVNAYSSNTGVITATNSGATTALAVVGGATGTTTLTVVLNGSTVFVVTVNVVTP